MFLFFLIFNKFVLLRKKNSYMLQILGGGYVFVNDTLLPYECAQVEACDSLQECSVIQCNVV